MTEYQRQVAQWLDGIDGWSTVCTWTWGGKWPGGPSVDSVQRHLLPWIDATECNPCFAVAERGMSGQRRWHAHGLLGRTPLGMEPHRAVLWSDWFKRYGRCRFEELDPNGGIAYYVSKYVSKSLGGTRWWIKSNGTFQ